MREITDIHELHAYVLDMLKHLDQICRENGITYYLSGGTMLGAIRHKGFIPWDDDADVMLPRADYEKLARLLMEKEDSRYGFGCIHNRADWTFPFARIWDKTTRVEYDHRKEAPVGICIDILPMDGLPDSLAETNRYYKHLKFRYVFLNAAVRKRFKPEEGFRTLKRILANVLRIPGTRRICAYIDHMASKIPFDGANYVGCTVMDHYMERERFPRRAFDGVQYVPFEDTTLPVPNGYDAYLSALYGDYMTPPDEAGKRSEHHMHVYVN